MPHLISIVIAAFNAERWISEAIRSGLLQTWPDLEVIVVDDGSTDRTAVMVRGMRDPRIKLIVQENRGQSAALNRGVAESSGGYIKFLDADDWLNPVHLEAQMHALAQTSQCVGSCRWGYFVRDPRHPAVRSEVTDRNYDDPREWLVDSLTKDEGMMGGWKWLIPRTVWDRCGGWDERLSLNNDFDFSIRLLLASGGVRFAPDAVYSYRKGISGALSGSRGPKAMMSASLTTECGCRALLAREDSPRIRRICANRWQEWLYKFYPEFPDLAMRAEAEVKRLGGSDVAIGGGRLQKLLVPLVGWKGVRRLQCASRSLGWRKVLQWKEHRRLAQLKKGPVA